MHKKTANSRSVNSAELALYAKRVFKMLKIAKLYDFNNYSLYDISAPEK